MEEETREPGTVVVVTDNRKLAERVYEVVTRLRGHPYWLDPKDYRLAVAKIRMAAGPYPAQPAGVVLDVLVKGLQPMQLANQLGGSYPPIPVLLVSPAAQEQAFTRATLAGVRTIVGILTHGENLGQLLSERLQIMLWPVAAPAENHVHRLKG